LYRFKCCAEMIAQYKVLWLRAEVVELSPSFPTCTSASSTTTCCEAKRRMNTVRKWSTLTDVPHLHQSESQVRHTALLILYIGKRILISTHTDVRKGKWQSGSLRWVYNFDQLEDLDLADWEELLNLYLFSIKMCVLTLLYVQLIVNRTVIGDPL
jgi:hypothetical protein